jgi:DNA-binding beta-propeller fold protein YncE
MKVLHAYCFFLILVLSCKKDVGKMNFGDYPSEIGVIVQKNCAVSGCHNSTSYQAAGGYNLDSWRGMFSGSNNGSPVIPFSSRFSPLCYYINTYPELGLMNAPVMPLNRNPLSKEDVMLIKNWIDAGARDVNGKVMWSEPNRKKLYAVNQGCDVVAVFDSETQLPMRYIEVGTKPGVPEAPHQVRVSPDGKFWYVIFINNNVMQKFSCADDSYIGTIPLSPLAAGTGFSDAQDWNTFSISKDGKRAYVVSWTQNGKVAAVDLENHKLIHFIGGLTNPHAVCLNKENTKVYVGAQTGNYITELDTGFTSANQISLQNGILPSDISSLDIHDIILSADEDDLMITCQKSNEVRVYSTILSNVTAIVPTGTYPQEIVYARSTNQYFVSCTYDSTTFWGKAPGVITRINAASFSTSNLKCGYQPHGIAVDEKKKLLYVLSRNVQSSGPTPHHSSICGGRNGFVNFVDLNNFSVTPKKFEMSVDPYFINARP